MPKKVETAFQMEGVVLALDKILPTKKIKNQFRKSAKYASIVASIKEVGVIEPLVVYPENAKRNQTKEYILLDGHMRFEILQSLAWAEAFCIISTDDEAFTYNHRVSRLAPIQEHYMIMKAIKNGVSEDRIANALKVDVSRIRQKQNMIKNICPEAVDLLKNKHISPNSLAHLKKAKPLRQIEIAELMIGANNFSAGYAQALIVATAQNDLVSNKKSTAPSGIRPEDFERMKKEMEGLERGFREIEDSFGQNTLNLTLAKGYLAKLLNNGKIIRFLSAAHPDILTEFHRIIESFPAEN